MIQLRKEKSNGDKMKFINQESGRSMIEMLGVLAIMGVITVGAITMISAAMRSQKRTAIQDEVAQVVTGVRTILGEYDDFSGLDNTTIFAAIGMSDKNPYGGKYSLAVNPADTRQFTLTIDGLNTSDCQFFKAKAWSDSIGYQLSDGKSGGAVAVPNDCSATVGQNYIQITYGE
jgi:hypothetical protein